MTDSEAPPDSEAQKKVETLNDRVLLHHLEQAYISGFYTAVEQINKNPHAAWRHYQDRMMPYWQKYGLIQTQNA